jgi:hypothetical protein
MLLAPPAPKEAIIRDKAGPIVERVHVISKHNDAVKDKPFTVLPLNDV